MAWGWDRIPRGGGHPMRRLFPFAVALVLGVAACAPNPETTGKAKSGKEERYPPCHPGCFPAGTAVATPDGPRPIETIRPGDVVLHVPAAGAPAPARVASVFAA